MRRTHDIDPQSAAWRDAEARPCVPRTSRPNAPRIRARDARRRESLPRYDPHVGSHYLGPWRVDVERRDGVERLVPAAALARTVAAALDAAGAPQPASIGLILANDAELAGLNAEHMGKSGATDVLSFPLLPPELFPPHAGRGATIAPATSLAFVLPPGSRPHLGDVVVSVERAIEQAAWAAGARPATCGGTPATSSGCS